MSLTLFLNDFFPWGKDRICLYPITLYWGSKGPVVLKKSLKPQEKIQVFTMKSNKLIYDISNILIMFYQLLIHRFQTQIINDGSFICCGKCVGEEVVRWLDFLFRQKNIPLFRNLGWSEICSVISLFLCHT